MKWLSKLVNVKDIRDKSSLSRSPLHDAAQLVVHQHTCSSDPVSCADVQCTYTCTCVMCVCVHVCTFVCMYIHAYKHACMHVCVCTCVCMRVRAYVHLVDVTKQPTCMKGACCTNNRFFIGSCNVNT